MKYLAMCAASIGCAIGLFFPVSDTPDTLKEMTTSCPSPDIIAMTQYCQELWSVDNYASLSILNEDNK